jgi:6-phosphofructokinase
MIKLVNHRLSSSSMGLYSSEQYLSRTLYTIKILNIPGLFIMGGDGFSINKTKDISLNFGKVIFSA